MYVGRCTSDTDPNLNQHQRNQARDAVHNSVRRCSRVDVTGYIAKCQQARTDNKRQIVGGTEADLPCLPLPTKVLVASTRPRTSTLKIVELILAVCSRLAG